MKLELLQKANSGFGLDSSFEFRVSGLVAQAAALQPRSDCYNVA